jgi:hypothetical protein
MASLEDPVSEINAAGGAPEIPKFQADKLDREEAGTNIGVWVLLSFAVLTLIATAVKGFVPLDLLEVAFWAGLAWFWYKKKIVSQVSRVVVGILAILVSFGEGYSVGRHSTASYTYLQMGNRQIRIDNSAGRTDQLWSTGWKPMSYDRPPINIMSEGNLFDIINEIHIQNGQWSGEEICFDVQNESSYVLKSISVLVTVTPKSNAESPSKLAVVLRPRVMGLLDAGDDGPLCGTAAPFPAQAEWSYEPQSYMGWKR